jgi:hypothetical protein
MSPEPKLNLSNIAAWCTHLNQSNTEQNLVFWTAARGSKQNDTSVNTTLSRMEYTNASCSTTLLQGKIIETARGCSRPQLPGIDSCCWAPQESICSHGEAKRSDACMLGRERTAAEGLLTARPSNHAREPRTELEQRGDTASNMPANSHAQMHLELTTGQRESTNTCSERCSIERARRLSARCR